MVNWQTEIEELHDVFQAYFLEQLLKPPVLPNKPRALSSDLLGL
jgi:hypothetical protein